MNKYLVTADSAFGIKEYTIESEYASDNGVTLEFKNKLWHKDNTWAGWETVAEFKQWHNYLKL